MLDWGLRLVVLLAVPCAVALLVFAQPLVATLFHYGAFSDLDVQQHDSGADAGYGVGLMGIVAIKVLAPGYYASHDMRTPMRIAVCVLVFTQVLNLASCRCCSMRAGAVDRHRRAGQRGGCCWGCCGAAATNRCRAGAFSLLQVVAASALAGGVFAVGRRGGELGRPAGHSRWSASAGWRWSAGAALLYFAALWASGLVTKLLRHCHAAARQAPAAFP
jgi:putative peptidoglycan lipid II flippase